MDSFTLLVNHIFSLFAIFGEISIVVIIISLLFRKYYFSKKLLSFIGKHVLLLGFLVTLGATIGSLIYSEIIGFVPCKLCWIQRAFIYPQVILFGLAIWKKDYKIIDYNIALSIVGAVVSFYQSYVLFGGTSLTPCTSLGGECSKLFFLEYGHITIPTMSLIAFVLVLVLMFARKAHEKHAPEGLR